MHPVFLTVVAWPLAFIGSAPDDTRQTDTVGSFLLSMPAFSVGPVIDYCSESVPEIKEDLWRQRAGFIEKLTEAEESVTQRLRNDPEFNAPVQESMRQEMAEVNANALNLFQQQDADITCRTALMNIQNATVDDLRKVLEDTYRTFRSAGQAGNAE